MAYTLQKDSGAVFWYLIQFYQATEYGKMIIFHFWLPSISGLHGLLEK